LISQTNLEDFSCASLHCFIFNIVKIKKGAPGDPQGLFLGQLGPPRTICWGASDFFQKSPNHEHPLSKCFLRLFSVKLGAIDAQSFPGHFSASVSQK
jgi:hypothetical protein